MSNHGRAPPVRPNPTPLHGLLLMPPPERGYIGPGFTSVPVTEQIAEAISARIAHPVRAAAVVTALFTGAGLPVLSGFRITDLSAGGALLSHRDTVGYSNPTGPDDQRLFDRRPRDQAPLTAPPAGARDSSRPVPRRSFTLWRL